MMNPDKVPLFRAITAAIIIVVVASVAFVLLPKSPSTPNIPTTTRAPGLYWSSQRCSPEGASRMGTQNSMGFDVCINGYWYVSYR